MKITQQRDFTINTDKNTPGIIRVENTKLAELGGRNSWVVIRSDTKKVYRMIRGSGRIQNFPSDLIECDYDTVRALDINTPHPLIANGSVCNLTIEKANAFEKFIGHWSHPDTFYRFPLKISLVSLALGAVGFFLGIVGIIK